MACFFVTGTDTEIGKTYVTTALLRRAAAAGLSCVGLKPVAAGGIVQSSLGEGNEDALALMAASTELRPYEEVNPVLLQAALSPHIAAAQEGRALWVKQIAEAMRPGLDVPASLTLIEGAGGWRAPLAVHDGKAETVADLAGALGYPVILVVGMRLGCLNHALLTAEAILRDGQQLFGWIANQCDPDMGAFEENLATLKAHLPAAYLGQQPYAGELDVDISDFV